MEKELNWADKMVKDFNKLLIKFLQEERDEQVKDGLIPTFDEAIRKLEEKL